MTIEEPQRSKQAHNNDKEGHDIPIMDWCRQYGLSTLDLMLCFNEFTPRLPGEPFKILTEKRLVALANAGGVINHNIPKEIISIPGEVYQFNFDQCYADRVDLILETNKEE